MSWEDIDKRIDNLRKGIMRNAVLFKEKVKQNGFQFKPFSIKQKQVLTWWCDDSSVKDMDGIIADGAIRSGKTVSMSFSFGLWAMTRFSNQNFGMCGKTIGSFRRNVLFWWKLMMKSRGYAIRDMRADNLVIVTKNGITNYFYIFGGKDERSQDLIQGITLAGVFFDEVALMPESFVNQATGRCSVDGSKYWFNCNPGSPYHWFKINWINKCINYKELDEEFKKDKKEEDEEENTKKIIYLHFTMDDNLSLSEEIKARYRSNFVGVFFKRYILGLWCMAEGVIYDMFEKSKHCIKTLNRYYTDFHISIDYGTKNPTVFLLWGKSGEGSDAQWHVIKEYYHDGRAKAQKTDEQYCDDLEKFADGYKIKKVIIDPSAESFIVAIKKRGNFVVTQADNEVLNGIRNSQSALIQNKVKIYEGCTNTIMEMYAYSWDQKAVERGEDKPIKDNDHCLDAFRYFINTILYRRGVWFG